MKKILALVLLCSLQSVSYAQSIFGKNAFKNQQDWDKQRIHYGYFLGFNSYDFKYNYGARYFEKHGSNTIHVTSNFGFNVGLVGNLRLHEYIDLRFEPGLYYTKRELFFPHATVPYMQKKEVNSTYIHFPLLLKFSSKRVGNIRPYVLAGLSESLNLGSKQNSKEDNYEGTFRMKTWTANYELGLGIDLYFEHFKFSPSIRGVFGMQDEMVRDFNPNSQFTGHIESLQSRGIFVNFTFH